MDKSKLICEVLAIVRKNEGTRMINNWELEKTLRKIRKLDNKLEELDWFIDECDEDTSENIQLHNKLSRKRKKLENKFLNMVYGYIENEKTMGNRT